MLSLISIRERVFIETSLVTWLLLGSAKLGGGRRQMGKEKDRGMGERDVRK